MLHILYGLSLVLVLGCLPGISQAQTGTSSDRKSTIEVFFPVCHFFDESKTNWGVLVPNEKRVFEPDGSSYKKDIRSLPPTFGVLYTRLLTRKASIGLSCTAYMRRYLTDSLTPGEVLRREYGLVSVGYTYQLLSRYSIRLDALGEVNYRHGFETVYIFQPQWFEIKVESPALRDLGASAGLRISYDLPFHFQLSGEAKYTRFLYLYDEGVDIFGDHKDPTANTLTLKLGLGYRF